MSDKSVFRIAMSKLFQIQNFSITDGIPIQRSDLGWSSFRGICSDEELELLQKYFCDKVEIVSGNI